MARTHSRTIGRRQNAIHFTAPGLRIGSSIHPERNSRMDRHRVQRARRFRPLLAQTRRNIQVRVRQENRPRGCFTIESGVQHQPGNFHSLLGLATIIRLYVLIKKSVPKICRRSTDVFKMIIFSQSLNFEILFYL